MRGFYWGKYKYIPRHCCPSRFRSRLQSTFKVVPFPGVKNINLPIYLTLSCKTVERAYTDGKVKAIAYNYSAEPVSIKPENIPYLEITNKGTSRFVDVTGITNKLNLDGNGKEVIVTFATPSTRENVSTGEKLSIMFGKICRYFADLKSIAFTGKATDISEDATHRFMTDSERTKLSSVETGANKYVHPSSHPADMITDTSGKVIMTAAERTKLSGIDVGANAYTHPATHPATIITEDTTHRFMTDTERTKLSGVETGANKYVHPSSHSADMIIDTSGKVIMTVAERTKLNGIAAGANAYVHPANHPATIITEDATHRFMTDTEKTKLSGVETGANKYVHPSSHSADMITDTSGKVIMTVAERTKLNGIAAGANAYTHPTNHPATIITEDTTHRFMTDTEKTKLSGVETGANKYVHPSSHSADMITDTSGKVIMTVAERTKLNGIAAGANAYTHPTSHPATMITGDSTHRFVSDSEKSTWNRKMEFACAGVITKTAAKDKYWGSTFSVIKSGTGYYRIKHELNKAHQVLAMCINADGEEGFVTIPYRSLTDFFFATNNTNGRQDMAFFFIIFTL